MKRFKSILYVTNALTGKEVHLEQAVTLAKMNHARLTVVDVIEKLPRDRQLLITFMHPTDLQDLITRERMRWMEALISDAEDEGVQITSKVIWGTPFLEIIREVLQNQHDLVMILAEGKGGPRDRLFGSTIMHLMRKCPCPVWALKPAQRQPYARILAAVDPDPSDNEKNALNEKIMELATSLAELEESELYITHTWLQLDEGLLRHHAKMSRRTVNEMTRAIQTMHQRHLDELLKKYDLNRLNTHVYLLQGEAGRVIPELANEKEIDLIVMGTVCRTGIPGFFIGNNAEKILHHVDCSVLAVKPDGFVTPVTLDES